MNRRIIQSKSRTKHYDVRYHTTSWVWSGLASMHSYLIKGNIASETVLENKLRHPSILRTQHPRTLAVTCATSTLRLTPLLRISLRHSHQVADSALRGYPSLQRFRTCPSCSLLHDFPLLRPSRRAPTRGGWQRSRRALRGAAEQRVL